jgi:hypothetical protein
MTLRNHRPPPRLPDLPTFKRASIREAESFIAQAERQFQLNKRYHYPTDQDRIDFCVGFFDSRLERKWATYEADVGFGQTTWEEFVEWIKDSIKDKGNRLIDAATAYASAKQKEHQTIDEFLFYLDPIEAQLKEKINSNYREALFGKLRKDIVAELLQYERQPHTRQELISAVWRIETSKKLQTEWD